MDSSELIALMNERKYDAGYGNDYKNFCGSGCGYDFESRILRQNGEGDSVNYIKSSSGYGSGKSYFMGNHCNQFYGDGRGEGSGYGSKMYKGKENQFIGYEQDFYEVSKEGTKFYKKTIGRG